MQASYVLGTLRTASAVLATSLGAFGLLAVAAPPAFADALPSNCTGGATVTCTFD